jgi:hypothetical protein
MATTLGKRNRRSSRSPEDSRQDEEQSGSFGRDAQEVFRRHFEAQFKPLPQVEKTVKVFEEEPDDESEEDPEWDGISDEEQTAVQIVEHTDQLSQITTMSKGELKSYMVRFLYLPQPMDADSKPRAQNHPQLRLRRP